MPTRTLLVFLFLIVFVGSSSCGDNTSATKDAEIAALRQALATRPPANGGTNVIYTTQINTSVVHQTLTNASSSTQTQSSGGTFTATGGGTGGTMITTYTSGSTNTGTAARQ